jgi:hypothetical protein
MAMTDDEKRKRLRILELEKERAEAAAAQEPISAPGAEASLPAPVAAEESNTIAPDTALGAAARGFAQGGTFGFADEVGGAFGAADELARRAFGGGGVYGDKPLRQALVERYLLERNANRQELAQARAARPVVTGAAELAGALAIPLPGAGAVRSAAQAGKVGLAAARAGALGAGAGALAGLGRTEADTVGGMAKDVAIDATLGGLTMAPLGAGAAKVVSGKAKAAADALEKTQKEADKAMRSARSALGGETSSGFRTLEQMERALNDPGVDAAARQKALDFLTSPEGQALKNQVLESASRRGTGQLTRIQDAEQAFADASKATDPAAVQQATADYLSQGLKPEVVPRAMRYLSRVIPVAATSAIGGAIGDTPGAVVGGTVGGVLAASMGAPGTALVNMLKSPRFRYSAASHAAPLLEAAAARGPAAFATTYYLLHSKHPEVQAAAEEAAKEEKASR